jgi:glycosyltransferase involved in cell wall biosynthesis
LAALSAGVKKLIAQAEAIDVGRSDFGWWLDRRLSRFTDRIITNSVAVRQFYMAHGLPASKFATIPKPIRPAEPARLERPEFLAQLGLPDNAKLILCLGALVKEKRLKELIWAVDQLKAVGVPAHLLVVGDGPLRKPLERYRRLNRIDDRVHFLGQREDVAELVAQADVLWQAGAHEGHSSAILEAMVAGKPVVAADAAGNGELVVNGVTGHLVPVRERAGFARWTLPLLENVELARRLGEAGKQRVLENHHVENIAQQYAELYRSLSRS